MHALARSRLCRWTAVLFISCALQVSSGFGIRQDAPSQGSSDFRLQRHGDVLRVQYIYEADGRVHAIAVAFQLAKTDERRQRFDLNLFVDGSQKQKRRFEVNVPIQFRARGTMLPFKVLVSRVDRNSVQGKVMPDASDAAIHVGLYSKKGKLQGYVHAEKETEGDVKQPVLKRQSLPSYTDSAVDAKVQGKLLIEVVIRKDGSTDSFRVLQSLGYFGLEEASIEAIANEWEFLPATLEGRPVDFRAVIQVTFSLRSR